MTVIEASTVKCATLVDGTLRMTLDIEPQHALAAFQLFGAPGRAVALAALKDARAAIEENRPTYPEPRTVRIARQISEQQREAAQANWHALGTLCKTAVMWCNTPEFQEWLGVDNAQDAGERVKTICQINSRKELDTSCAAAANFRQHVIAPYQKYMVARGYAQHSN